MLYRIQSLNGIRKAGMNIPVSGISVLMWVTKGMASVGNLSNYSIGRLYSFWDGID